MKINIKFLPIKAHYFFYWGGVATIWSYIAVFGKQMGISEVGVGFIFTVAPIAGLIAKPLFGAIADRFKKKKMIFLFFLLLNLMSYLCVAFLPQNEPERPVQLECGIGMSYIRQCGRINHHCAANVMATFKPKSERNKNKLVFNDTEWYRSARSVLENGELIEYCEGYCKVHSFLNGINFCHRLYDNNVPDICLKMKQGPEEMENSSMALMRTELDDVNPYIISFDVKLKINEVDTIQDPTPPHGPSSGYCLYLPIAEVEFLDSPDGSRGLSCSQKYIMPDCYINCENNTALNGHLETIQVEEELLDAMNFWMYGSLVVISWVAMAVVESLGDAMCFQTLGNEPQLYGKQRLWGALGWGTFNLIAGYLIDSSSQGKLLKDYTPAFYLLATLFTIDLVVAYKWTVKEVEKTKSLRRDICSVLSNVRIVVFIVACVIVGMCTGLLWSFLFWYVENLSEKLELQDTCEGHKWIKLLQGLISTVQCLGELPFFFISGWLIQKLGHVHCITLVLAAFGARFIIYSLIVNPWMMLPVELLQGLTYGIFYATMVSYANKISPIGTSATVIGVVQSAFMGIGVASGSLVGGLIFQKYSGSTAFRVFGIGCLVFCVIHFFIMCLLDKKSSYGFPSDRTEPEGQEMFKISSSNQDVAESDEGCT